MCAGSSQTSHFLQEFSAKYFPMPDLNDLKKRLQMLREEMVKRMPDIAATLTLSAKAMAERKIVDEGFGRKYSENKVPAWFLHGKEINAKGTKFLADRGVGTDGKQGDAKKKRRKKKGDPDPGSFSKLTNWKEFREAQGLQTEHVDLHYSNQTFANMQPVKIVQEGNVVMAPLGATNVEAQNKMNWNRDRYGDFIGKALDEKAREQLTEVVIGEVAKVVDQIL